MIRCILLVLVSTTLFGQVKNPFEIGNRMGVSGDSVVVASQRDDQTERMTDTIKAEYAQNPFDINVTAGSTAVNSNTTDGRGKPISVTKTSTRQEVSGFLLTFLSIILLSVGVLLNRSKFISILKSVYNNNFLRTLSRSTNVQSDLQLFLLYVMAIVNLSLFTLVSIRSDLFSWSQPFDPSFLSILGVFLGIYGVRHLTMWFINWVFPLEYNAISFNYSIAYHNVAIGFFLLPVVLGLQFGPDSGFKVLFYLGIGIVLVVYLMRQFKGGLMALGIKGFNPMYFFLYLCAIEFAPILIGMRVVFNPL